jgi:Ca2+-binding EF-hand superfamily protein
MFRFFDQNKDGFIDGDEMKAAIKVEKIYLFFLTS